MYTHSKLKITNPGREKVGKIGEDGQPMVSSNCKASFRKKFKSSGIFFLIVGYRPCANLALMIIRAKFCCCFFVGGGSAIQPPAGTVKTK